MRKQKPEKKSIAVTSRYGSKDFSTCLLNAVKAIAGRTT